MAHYAQLDNRNYVIQVIKVDDEHNSNYLTELFGENTRWVQTSYNTYLNVHSDETKQPFRKNFAGIGFFYDARLDGFIPPKPYPSWTLNEETCGWEPPTPYPNDPGVKYDWFELGQRWERA
jgi:hypothetical protein